MSQSANEYLFGVYSHLDRTLVSHSIARYSDAGLQVYYDQGVQLGHAWFDQLSERISRASGILFFQSTRSLSSDCCQLEIDYARALGKPIWTVPLKSEHRDRPQLTGGGPQPFAGARRTWDNAQHGAKQPSTTIEERGIRWQLS